MPVGAAVVAVMVGLFTRFHPAMFALTFAIAFAHIFFIAMPVYLLLPPRIKHHWLSPLIGGFAIGALPTAIFFSDQISSTDWTDFFVLVGMAGLLGVTGALGSWLVWKYLQAPCPQDSNPAQTPSS